MYDWPEVAEANQALWTAIATRLRAEGIAAPQKLERSRDVDSVWHDEGLILSQTCGLPFSTRLRGLVRLIGTPIYDVPGCDGPNYSSMIVMRGGDSAEALSDARARRFAYNSVDSFSGFLALRAAMREARIDPDFVEWIETGSHRASVSAVAGSLADVAAIDPVCWSFALRYEQEAAERLKVIGTTPLRPGLPLITAIERSDDEVRTIRAAIKEALADPATQGAREVLRIAGLGLLDEWDYSATAALARQFLA